MLMLDNEDNVQAFSAKQLQHVKLAKGASMLVQPKPHPNEKLSNKQFNKKYHEEVLTEYNIQESEESNSDRVGNEKDSIDLEEESAGEDGDSDGLLEPAEYSY
ncbi:hypothetical protein O181_034022 [Austropuccinia psidii MF-1]|uniref:Uncharacterized protein n=1 Tax=Austropuccinia psidii MF-1 TaxID=1389203 RepID=A0A9Q3H7P5_9BASI|nr:hypothetical protein [Austropuccinia psidii MF-1]